MKIIANNHTNKYLINKVKLIKDIVIIKVTVK